MTISVENNSRMKIAGIIDKELKSAFTLRTEPEKDGQSEEYDQRQRALSLLRKMSPVGLKEKKLLKEMINEIVS
tara:strand:- start:289 stop:510 length:222 start_codon:yes stop_codon:yes gene_type:complete